MKWINLFCLTLISNNLLAQDIEGYVTDPQVPSCNNGEINLTMNGGFDEYTFKWSNDDETKDIQNLEQGNYSVTVTDNLCGTAILSFELECEVPDCEIISDVSDETCNNKGKIDIEMDCDPNPGLLFTYFWSDGESQKDRTNLDQGEYSLTVTDNNGSTYEGSYMVGGTTVLDVEITNVVNLTDCSVHNGRIDTKILSGTPPYNIEWSNGATNTLSLTNLNVGWHTMTVTDANNCSKSVSRLLCCCGEGDQNTYECPDSGPITIEGTVSVDDKSIVTTVSGGTSDYICTWTGPGIDESFGCGGINNLELGKYYLEVNDGCDIITDCFILADCSDVELDISESNILFPCKYVFDSGSITANVSGGTEPYSYSWDNMNGGTGTGQTFTEAIAGKNYVTVTDANGCSASKALKVNESIEGNLVVGTDCKVYCNGTLVDSWNLSVETGNGPDNCDQVEYLCTDPTPDPIDPVGLYLAGTLTANVEIDPASVNGFGCTYNKRNSITGQ